MRHGAENASIAAINRNAAPEPSQPRTISSTAFGDAKRLAIALACSCGDIRFTTAALGRTKPYRYTVSRRNQIGADIG